MPGHAHRGGDPQRTRTSLSELRALVDVQLWQLEALPRCAPQSPPRTPPPSTNALIKAHAASAACGCAALADDSGLMVDALDGAPGIHSARFAGEGSDDTRNNRHLLEALRHVPRSRRGAHYVCALVLLRHPEDPRPLIAEGSWRGSILQEGRGSSGFGYDPLFYVPRYRCSVAELAPALKASVSHRARAMRALLRQLARHASTLTDTRMLSEAASSFDPERIPLSLYVHFPWCVHKCPYCDFNSHGLEGALPETAYIDALLRDLAFELTDFPLRPLQSIFLGGGTPSLFSGTAIARLLQGVWPSACRLPPTPRSRSRPTRGPPMPNTSARLPPCRGQPPVHRRAELGTMRCSRAPGPRPRRGAQAQHAVALARAAGFDNLNLDHHVRAAAAVAGEEGLADPGTGGGGGCRAPVLVPAHHRTAHRLPPKPAELARRRSGGRTGGRRARPPAAGGLPAVRGLRLCTRGSARASQPQLPGPLATTSPSARGAHGKRTPARWRVAAAFASRTPGATWRGAGSAAVLRSELPVAPAELPFEFALNAFRLTEGFALEDFERRTGAPASLLAKGLARADERGLSEQRHTRIRPTARGQAFLNDLIQGFLP